MKQVLLALVTGAGLVAAGVAQAADAMSAEDLLKKNACTACHAVDKKGVGPAYKDVAAKYRGQKDAEAKLIDKVKKGGTGVWGQVPMPPNPAVKDDELKTMVQYVLSLK
jgi:cytochrome c